MPAPVSSRLRPPTDPVRITFDGEEIVAERGEPICAALVAAGRVVVARSPKFHRPRGPSCMRAACDGCLARVDDTPNIMTCMTPCEEGTSVVTQNRLGPREADFLRMTDWFFPEGLNHHELFAGVPGVQQVMQAFARRVAGLGKLPAKREGARAAERRAVDVVVVGGGPSGMAIATRLAKKGRAVEILDDQLSPGGGALALPDDEALSNVRASCMKLARGDGLRIRARTTAAGVYGRDLLVVGPDGAEILEPKTLVLACGAHDGVLAFEGNDVPGVMSARAAGLFLSRGVLVGERVVVIAGPGPFGDAYARAAGKSCKVEVIRGEPIAAKGATRVKSVVVKTSRGEKKLEADAVLVDAPRAPAYELAEQAGAKLRHESAGYVVVTDGGLVADDVYAVGEMTGTPIDAARIEVEAERVAARILG
jgi:sarcosine oxidase subunit alpha